MMCNKLVLILLLACNVTVTVYGAVIIQEPKSALLSLSANNNATFNCEANSTNNVTRFTWNIMIRELTLNSQQDEMLLNNYGVNVGFPTSHLSVLSVKRRFLNNNTEVKCSVYTSANLTPVQSPQVKLTLFGPPNAVNFTNVLPILHGFQLSWSPVVFHFDSIPFNYGISINSASVNRTVTVNQNETVYVFQTEPTESCMEYNFTLQTVNDAGYSSKSTPLILRVPTAPNNIIVNSSEVFFTNGQPQIRLYLKQHSTCCDYYPITNYTVTIVEEGSLNNSTSFILSPPNNSTSSCDSHGTLSTNESGMIPNRRYFISVSASNIVGMFNVTNSLEIVTTSLQGIRAVLIGNNLTINCYFVNGSTANGCSLQVFLLQLTNSTTNHTSLTDIITFERPTLTTLTATGIIQLYGQYMSSSLLVVATDYYSNDNTSEITLEIIPTIETMIVTPSISTTTSVSMTMTSMMSSTPSITLTVTPSVGGAGVSISQSTIAIIVGTGAAFLIICLIALLSVTVVTVRVCARKRKGKTFIVDRCNNDGTNTSGSVKRCNNENGYADQLIQPFPSHIKSDTLHSHTSIQSEDVPKDFRNIVGPDLENFVTPYGITTLVQPDPQEPVYQELPDRPPPLFTQTSTTPLLETSVTPPPIAPRGTYQSRIPVYHVLEESAGSSQSSNEPVPLYDEVPVFQGTESIDGPGSISEGSIGSDAITPVPTSSSLPPLNFVSTTPTDSRPYHVLEPNHSNNNNNRSPPTKNGFPKRAVSNLDRLHHEVTLPHSLNQDTTPSYPPSPTRSYAAATPTSRYPPLPPRPGRQYSCQNSFNTQLPVVETNGGERMKKSVSVPAAMRQRCNSTGNSDYICDRLGKDQRGNYLHGTWTLKRTLV